MSKKRCAKCGADVDAFYDFCPYCGQSLDVHYSQIDEQQPSSRPEERKTNPGCSCLMSMIITIIIGIIGGLSWYLYNLHNEDIAEDIAHRRRLDSIAESHRLMARMDSLKRDSIAWARFTSPDLDLFDLRGHVGMVCYHNADVPIYREDAPDSIVTFDRNGCLTDSLARLIQQPADTTIHLVKKENTITKIITPRAELFLRYADYDSIGNWTRCVWTFQRRNDHTHEVTTGEFTREIIYHHQ
ncbi:MAG: hypothetical protein J1E63_09610 [Muribaculaceae bacterium]|nr:hypothetical protein [Muribaculaceae bacterium]